MRLSTSSFARASSSFKMKPVRRYAERFPVKHHRAEPSRFAFHERNPATRARFRHGNENEPWIPFVLRRRFLRWWFLLRRHHCAKAAQSSPSSDASSELDSEDASLLVGSSGASSIPLSLSAQIGAGLVVKAKRWRKRRATTKLDVDGFGAAIRARDDHLTRHRLKCVQGDSGRDPPVAAIGAVLG